MDNKHKYLKRFLAFVLSAAMVITYMPTSLFAYAGTGDGSQEVQTVEEKQPDTVTPSAAGGTTAGEEAQPAEGETQSEPETEDPVPSKGEQTPSGQQDAQTKDDTEQPEAKSGRTFTGNANSVDVSVEAEPETFPEGTEMSVRAVENETVQDAVSDALNGRLDDFRAVDVSFHAGSEDGIQPAGTVKMTMKSPDLAGRTDLKVLHIADNSEKAEVVDDVTFDEGKATFYTSGFSTYVLAAVSDDESSQDKASAEEPAEAKKAVKAAGLKAAAQETVDVSVAGVDGVTTKTITLGDFEGNTSLDIDGYEFVEAWYGNVLITGIQKDENNQVYFGTVEGNTITAITVDPAEVVLHYEKQVEKHKVDYKVTVDGTEVSDYSAILELVGPSSIKTGGTIEILPAPVKGYSLSSVTATEGTVSQVSGTDKYQLTGVTQDTVVTVALTETKSYRFSFVESSNTTLAINGSSYNSGTNHNTTYTPEESVSFTLTGRNQWSSNPKILNQLSITLDGNSKAALIPDTRGESVTTKLTDEYQVTVTKETATALPRYRVTITATNGDKVRGDISVTTNFKDYNSSEVWAKQLDGVEPLAYSHGTTYVTADTGGTNDRRLTPDAFTFYNRDTSRSSAYYIKAKNGYDLKDLKLYVYNYRTNVSGGAYVVTLVDTIYNGVPVSSLNTIGNNLNNALSNAGYTRNDHYFTLSADNSRSGIDYDDVRIFIRYEPDETEEQTYTVWYDPDNGETAYQEPGGKEYKLSEGKSTVISEDIPVRKGYVFDGWYLAGDEDNLHDPGDLFTVDESVKDFADSENKLTFKAKWTSESSAVYAPYKISVYFEDENGRYNDGTSGTTDIPDLTTSERGNIGSVPYIISSRFSEWLDTQKEGWDEDYEYDRQTPSEAVKADGSTVIRIYYREKRATLKFVAKDNVDKINIVSGADKVVETSGDGTKEVTVVVRRKQADAVTVQGVAADGYIINGWTINDETEKLTEKSTLATKKADDKDATDKWTNRTYYVWAETSKTITVSKEVHVIGTVHKDDVDVTVWFALDRDTSGKTDYLTRDDGSIWTESITIKDGVPETNSVSFEGVPAGDYEVWEVKDAEAGSLRPGDAVIKDSEGNNIIISNIQTKHDATSSGSNDVSVSDDKTTDSMTVINTFAHEGESISWTAKKTWTDKDGNTITDIPEGAWAEFGIFANESEEPVSTIRLDGTVEADDLEEKTPWEATFDALSRVDEDGNAITYVVKEIDYSGKDTPLDGKYYIPVHDTIDASGMSINNKQQYGDLEVKKTVDVTGFTAEEVQAAVADLEVTVTGPHNYSETVSFTDAPSVSGTQYTFTYTLSDIPAGEYEVKETGYENLFDGRTWNEDGSVTETKAVVEDSDTASAELKNNYHYIDITATKVWDDGDEASADHLAVNLSLYSKDGSEETLVSRKTIPAGATGDALTVTWENQDQQYDYVVKESRLRDYEEPVVTGDKVNGFTVTNSKMAKGTLRIVKTVTGADEAKEKTFQVNYESQEEAQGGISSVRLHPESGTAQTEVVVTEGKYTITEQPSGLNIDNYTRKTTLKVNDGEETTYEQDAEDAPHLTDVEVKAGETTTVTITNAYTEDTVEISYVSEDTDRGTVSPANETLGVKTGVAKGSTATPEPGYVFRNWTIGEGDEETEVSTSATFIPEKKADELWTARTYTAHFDTLPITIESATNNWTYDGSLHKDETYTVKYGDDAVAADEGSEGKVFTLPTGDVLTITPTAEGVRDVADNAENNNTYTYTVMNGDEDTKANYTITDTAGTLTINPKAVTITAKDASKTYDGSALTQPEFTVSALESGDTHTFEVEMTADSTITNAGTKSNVIATVDGEAVTTGTAKTIGNYVVTTVDGTLTVTRKAVTITAKDASKPYDGSALTQPEFTASALEDGDTHNFTVVMTADSTITDAGTQPNVIATVDGTAVKTGEAKEIGNYVVTTVDGTLTVTKDSNSIVISSATHSWPYDGSRHKDETYTVKYGDADVQAGADGKTFTLSNGDVVTITPTAAGVTNVSDNAPENNTYTYTVTKNGKDTSENYSSITANKGTLRIEPKEVTITAKNASKTYDGSALTQPEFTSSALASGDDHEFTVAMTADSTITDAGTQPNVIATVDGTAVKTGEAKQIGNYLVTTVNGILTVSPKKVTITAKDASKTYDGSALTQPEFTASALEDGDTHTFTVAMTADSTITNAGTQPNVIATVDGTEVATGTETKVGNYFVTTVNGTLTVNPKAVTITAKDASKTYDGSALTQPEFTASQLESGDDHEFAVVMTADSTITNIGTQPNVIATVDGTSVATGTETRVGNYLVTTVNGTLTVSPKKVTITAKDASKTYDGSALTQPEFTVSALEDGDTHTFTVAMTAASTITDYGTQPNVIATVDGVSVKTGTEKAVGNYLVTTVDGELSISRKAVTIKAKDASKEYDGTALTQPEFTVEGLPEADTHTFTVEMTADSTITDKGTKPNVIAKVDGTAVKPGELNPIGNYMVTVQDGELEVTPKAVTITAKDAGKTYDGDPLTQDEFTATGQASTDSHTFAVVMTEDSTITDAGTQPNVIATVDGTAVKTGEAKEIGNYVITTADGTLTVDPADMEDPDDPGNPDTSRFDVSDPSDLIYNGKDQKQPLTITDKETGKTLTEDKDFAMVYSGDLKNVTDDGITITVTGKGNYTGTFTKTYKITPAPLTVTTASAAKEYDGTPLTKTDEYTIEGLVNDETAELAFTGSQTEVGESENTAEVDWNGTAVESNYEVTYNFGTLTVTELPVYEIIYDLNGGEYDGSTADIIEIYEKGEVISIHEAPTRDGYVFSYWQGSAYQPGDSYTVTGDHKFTAVWVAIENTDGDKDGDSNKGVKTGDGTDIPGAVGGFFASLAALLGAFYVRRKSNSDEE